MIADEWLPTFLAEPDGTLCDLRFRDALGTFDVLEPHFIHDDGHWYRVEPPMRIEKTPTHYRPGSYELPEQEAPHDH